MAEETKETKETKENKSEEDKIKKDIIEQKSISTIDVGKALLEKQIVSKDQIDVALKEQATRGGNETLGSILVKMGFITEAALGEVLSESTGVKKLDLKSAIIDQRLVKKVPKGFAMQNKVIPVSYKGNVITIAIADIFDIITIDQIKRFFPANFKIQPVYASETDILNAIDQYYEYEMSIDGILKEIESGEMDIDEQESMQGDYKSPMVRLVDALLTDAVRMGASDLHFEPESFFLRLRYRIDGKMEQVRAFHKDYWSSIAVRIKIMSGMNIAETRRPQDGRIQSMILGRRVDFRVCAQPTVDGENIVMRILDEKQAILSLEKLGFSENTQKILKKCIKRPEGVVVMTGPTGSGKTTTLYTILNMINNIDRNIMTLENPVEYRLPLIRQSNVNPEIGWDFADGVRTVLRQDPDIILVGEIRDEETAITAVQASMTGHQVYTSLHTNDAFSTIPRLLQIGVKPYLLAGALICIIAQRLARKLCVHCKQEYKIPEKEKKMIVKVIGEEGEKVKTLYKAVGCPRCRNNGYSGRTAIAEILDVDKEIDDMITKQISKKDLYDYVISRGFITMQEDGVKKVIQGITSLDELIRVIDMTAVMELE